MSKFYNTLKVILESITNASHHEIKYYLEEYLVGVENIQSRERSEYSNKVFEAAIVEFEYKGEYNVKVYTSGGIGSIKTNNPSISVNVYVYDLEGDKVLHEFNAFHNSTTKDVNYDPVINTGENVAKYVISILSDGGDEDTDIPSSPPKNTSRRYKANKNVEYA